MYTALPLRYQARKKILFVSCNGLKKNRVGKGGSVKTKNLHYFFGQKCLIYVCFTLIGSWEGGKKLWGRDFFE